MDGTPTYYLYQRYNPKLSTKENQWNTYGLRYYLINDDGLLIKGKRQN